MNGGPGAGNYAPGWRVGRVNCFCLVGNIWDNMTGGLSIT